MESDQAVICGTLLNASGVVSYPRARLIALEVIRALKNKDGSLPPVSKLTMSDIVQKLTTLPGSKLKRDRILQLLRPFTQSSPYTHDLPKAAYALQSFNADMHDIRWTSNEFLSGPCPELDVAYGRFCEFLRLFLFPEKGPICAARDMDLIWHTMQLENAQYRNVMVSICGIFVNHISSKEEPVDYEYASVATPSRWEENLPTTAFEVVNINKPWGSEGGDKQYDDGGGHGPSLSQDFLVDNVLVEDCVIDV